MSNFDETVIVGNCTLPSLGKVYYGREMPAEITMSSMTTAHEMKRLSPTTRNYEVMCGIIDDCMKTDIGMSSYDMCLADYAFLLYKLRIATYGAEYPISSQCPLCGCRNDGVILISDLAVKMYEEENVDKYMTFRLPVTGKEVRIKFQTPRMMDNTREWVNEFKRRPTSDKSLDLTLIYSLMQIIETVDGKKMDQISLESWIRGLPMMDTNTIWQYSSMLEDSIGVERDLNTTCDICGQEYITRVSINKEFFRPSLKF